MCGFGKKCSKRIRLTKESSSFIIVAIGRQAERGAPAVAVGGGKVT